MNLPKEGTMRPIKKVLGWTLLVAGVGLIFMPDQTIAIISGQKVLCGFVLVVAGYFGVIAGRQR